MGACMCRKSRSSHVESHPFKGLTLSLLKGGGIPEGIWIRCSGAKTNSCFKRANVMPFLGRRIQREKTGTFRGEGGWGGSEVRSDLGLQGYGRHHRMRRKKFYNLSNIIIFVPGEKVWVFSLFLMRKWSFLTFCSKTRSYGLPPSSRLFFPWSW